MGDYDQIVTEMRSVSLGDMPFQQKPIAHARVGGIEMMDCRVGMRLRNRGIKVKPGTVRWRAPTLCNLIVGSTHNFGSHQLRPADS
jgi:hypothetical protein